MAIGDNIRMERLKQGISTVELGEAVGVSHVMILKYEDGQSIPNAVTACKIAKVLHTTVEKLVKGG